MMNSRTNEAADCRTAESPDTRPFFPRRNGTAGASRNQRANQDRTSNYTRYLLNRPRCDVHLQHPPSPIRRPGGIFVYLHLKLGVSVQVSDDKLLRRLFQGFDLPCGEKARKTENETGISAISEGSC